MKKILVYLIILTVAISSIFASVNVPTSDMFNTTTSADLKIFVKVPYRTVLGWSTNSITAFNQAVTSVANADTTGLEFVDDAVNGGKVLTGVYVYYKTNSRIAVTLGIKATKLVNKDDENSTPETLDYTLTVGSKTITIDGTTVTTVIEENGNKQIARGNSALLTANISSDDFAKATQGTFEATVSAVITAH